MVLARSAGMTTFIYNGVGMPAGCDNVPFYLSFGNNVPEQPDHWQGSGALPGYRTTPDIFHSPNTLAVEGDRFNFFLNDSSIVLEIAAGPTNDWYSFDNNTGKNDGADIEENYSDVPFPQYNYMLLEAARIGATDGPAGDVNALYAQDDNDQDIDFPPPETDPTYELTSRSGWTHYSPNKPASARLMKRFVCGNHNKIAYATKTALTTAVSDDVSTI